MPHVKLSLRGVLQKGGRRRFPRLPGGGCDITPPVLHRSVPAHPIDIQHFHNLPDVHLCAGPPQWGDGAGGGWQAPGWGQRGGFG